MNFHRKGRFRGEVLLIAGFVHESGGLGGEMPQEQKKERMQDQKKERMREREQKRVQERAREKIISQQDSGRAGHRGKGYGAVPVGFQTP